MCTRFRPLFPLGLGLLAFGLASCHSHQEEAAVSDPADANEVVVQDDEFKEILLCVQKEYMDYGRVDDELRWAPTLCRLPNPSFGRISESTHEATHGRKLYYVLASNRYAYQTLEKGLAPVGQTLVKEAWMPVESQSTEPLKARLEYVKVPAITDEGKVMDEHASHWLPYAAKDGQLYEKGEFAGLYVMHKLEPSTPGTDAGWIYGTLSASGEVTSSGRITSCMSCHTDAPHDRQFGLPAATEIGEWKREH